ncbi:hypothetical protein LP417_22110 [Polaromonas sp. P1-6]|nr:hypothetical protein LP417_22110 [Polaromonas sp. P1-6]
MTRQVELLVARQRRCENCGLIRTVKDYHDIHYGSLFGNVRQCSAMFGNVRQCSGSRAAVAELRVLNRRGNRRPSWSALDIGGIGVRAEPTGRDDSLCQVG